MADFFELQDKAKQHTKILVVYFFLAVLFIIAGVNLGVWVVAVWQLDYHFTFMEWLQQSNSWITSAIVLVVIVGISLKRMRQLGNGGHAVATMMNARRVHTDTNDIEERKFLNVVEEMSIASGVTMPGVYVMDEESGINAFAAGLKPSLAVVVVTKGALSAFSRDELQGVVGHEFSHILNGDMRINVKLIGILAGILAIGQLGGFILRTSLYSHSSRRGISSSVMSNSNKKGGFPVPILVLGLSLFVVGYTGLFFARLIKAGISRQREFLADASSVQFTRNKNGIIDALKKIQTHSNSGILKGAHVEDTNHMCFESSVGITLNKLLGTHPPIDERIKALSPWYRGLKSNTETQQQRSPEQVETAAVMGFSSTPTHASPKVKTAKQVVQTIGQLKEENLTSALATIQTIPAKIWSQCQSSITAAKLMVFAIVVHAEPEDWHQMKLALQKQLPENEYNILTEWVEQLLPLKGSIRLALLNHVIPQLQTIETSALPQFWKQLLFIIKFNGKVQINEYVIYALLKLRLENIPAGQEIKSLKSVKKELAQMIAAFQYSSGQDAIISEQQYHTLMNRFALGEIPSIQVDSFDAKLVHHALIQLSRLSPLLKRPVIEALADSVVADGKIENDELELLRTVCDYMDCPMPLLA